MDTMKEQICICIVGFGWKDLHHPWSKNGKEYSPDELYEHSMKKIIPEQPKHGIPDRPTMELPSRKDTTRWAHRQQTLKIWKVAMKQRK